MIRREHIARARHQLFQSFHFHPHARDRQQGACPRTRRLHGRGSKHADQPANDGGKDNERVYEDQAPEKGHACLLYESARASPTKKREPVITMTSSSPTEARTCSM